MSRAGRVVFSLVAAMGLSVAASAAVFTVGPHGSYATVVSALASAPSGGDTEIRVEAGTYSEQAYVSTSFTSGSILLTGGWDAAFTSRNPDPSLTVLSSPVDGNAFDIQPGGGTVEIVGFTITTTAAAPSRGVLVAPSGITSAVVKISECLVTGVSVSTPHIAYGAGLYANLNGTERLELIGVDVIGNTLQNTTDQETSGGGMVVSAEDSSTVLIADTMADGNAAVSATGNPSGGGMYLVLREDAAAEVDGLTVSGNTLETSGGLTAGAGLLVATWDTSSAVLRRVVAIDNSIVQGTTSEQVRLVGRGSSTIDFTDSGIAFGNASGISASSVNTSTVHLANLTVVDNPGTGIVTGVAGTMSLYNSIAYGNGTDTGPLSSVDVGHNLFGVDPGFVEPPYDYRLMVGSPGHNAGSNTPPGGLGTFDLNGLPRVQDGVVDIGCYEGAVLFAGGFESGGTTRWSATLP